MGSSIVLYITGSTFGQLGWTGGQVDILESKIEKYLTRRITAAGGICWKWPATARAGVPDRIVVIDGQVIFVELKAPGGRVSRLQQHTHEQMREAGARVEVLWSKKDIEIFLQNILTN